MWVIGNRVGMMIGSVHQLVNIGSGVVRQRIHFEVRPEQFHRVQLGSIRREKGDVNRTAAFAKLRRSRSMDIQTVPYGDDRRAELTAKIPDKPKNVWGDDVLIGEERKVKPHPVSPRRYRDRRYH